MLITKILAVKGLWYKKKRKNWALKSQQKGAKEKHAKDARREKKERKKRREEKSESEKIRLSPHGYIFRILANSATRLCICTDFYTLFSADFYLYPNWKQTIWNKHTAGKTVQKMWKMQPWKVGCFAKFKYYAFRKVVRLFRPS